MDTMRYTVKRHPALFLAAYAAVYNLVFWALEVWNRPVHIVHCRIDDLMPFCKWAVIPYVSWFIWVPAVVLLVFYRHSIDDYWRILMALVSGISFSIVVYMLYPTGLNLRHTPIGQDVCSHLLRMLYQVDTPTNVCPSLHVYVSVLLALAVFTAPWVHSALLRWANALLALMICASTVLIDQHSVIDVICGAALALFVYAAYYLVPVSSRVPSRRHAIRIDR